MFDAKHINFLEVDIWGDICAGRSQRDNPIDCISCGTGCALCATGRAIRKRWIDAGDEGPRRIHRLVALYE